MQTLSPGTPTYPEYADLVRDAGASVRADGNFVDPAKMRAYQQLRRGHDWRIAVIGHGREPDLVEMHMLLLADRRDLDPPLPQWLAERRAEQRAKLEAEKAAYEAKMAALRTEWEALVAALPVPVGLAYNYSGGNHYETWCQGAVHILLREPLKVGRLDRVTGEALCTTPSTRQHQDFATDQDPSVRIPTCKACIRTACRATKIEAPSLLRGRK